MDSITLDSELCDFCTEVNRYITTPGQKSFTHYRYTKIVLTVPSPHCLFCDRVNEYLRGIGHHQHWLSVTDDQQTDCGVYVRRSSLGAENGLECEIDLHIGQLRIDLGIWADEGLTRLSRIKCKLIVFTDQTTGSRAAEFIVSRPPIFKDDSERTIQLIRNWLSVCSDTHGCDQCSYSREFIDEDEVDLPTRILKIDAQNEQLAVKLIETPGMKGRYCALSHCWGDPEKMPLRSTTSNIHEHLEKLQWDKLPKTFQDSIIVCGGLGIEYLWIDSLCIIQDDTADWSREASRMGSLYKNALLVLVASGSSDSTGGLFIGDRPDIPSFTLPFYGIEDSTQTDTNLRDAAEIYHLMFAPRHELKSPSKGPLAQRGWALQEWHLARRKVSFMPGGMTWTCACRRHDERGYFLDLAMYSNLSWACFLEDYTSRRLTYHTDRLKAVEGVASEMRRSGRKGYKSGTWADNCIPEVLWIPLQQSQEKDDLLDVPSWSWASTGSPKNWLFNETEHTWHDPASTICLASPNSLHLSGQLITADTIQPLLHDCCIIALSLSTKQAGPEYRGDTIRMLFLKKFLATDWFNEPDLKFRRLFIGFRAAKSLRGLALMDSVLEDQDNISCILLARIDLDGSVEESDEDSDEEMDEESDEELDEELDEESVEQPYNMYPDFPVSHHEKVSHS